MTTAHLPSCPPVSADGRLQPALPPALVLDTNVVLDWLVFRNPCGQALTREVALGSVRWLASPAMRCELTHVLSRGVVDRYTTDPSPLWAFWTRHAVELADPPTIDLPQRLRCTDPDDQKFIDFALSHRTRWLLSRDKAVLKLAKRARLLGLIIVKPEDWSPSF